MGFDVSANKILYIYVRKNKQKQKYSFNIIQLVYNIIHNNIYVYGRNKKRFIIVTAAADPTHTSSYTYHTQSWCAHYTLRYIGINSTAEMNFPGKTQQKNIKRSNYIGIIIIIIYLQQSHIRGVLYCNNMCVITAPKMTSYRTSNNIYIILY